MGNNEYKDVIISAIERPRQDGIAKFYFDKIGYSRASRYLINHDFKNHVHQWCSYDDQNGNSWYPLYYHPDRYAFNTHYERGPDKGETPTTSLAMHTMFKWYNPNRKYVDLSCGITFTCEMGFDGDLKGASAHFFILIGEIEKSTREKISSSGRYHLNTPSLQIKLPYDGGFAKTNFRISSDDEWVAYYLRDKSLDLKKVKPDLRFVEGFGIAFHNFKKDRLPVGILKCRKFMFEFDS